MEPISECLVDRFVPIDRGFFWNRYFPYSASQVSSFSPIFSVLFILLIVGFVLSAKKSSDFRVLDGVSGIRVSSAHGWLSFGLFYSPFFSVQRSREPSRINRSWNAELRLRYGVN